MIPSTRAENLYLAAVALPPAERESFLDHACTGDHELRKQVETLISHGEAGEAFFAGLSSPLASFRGRTLGPYRLISELGEGGMGAVFMAERADPQLTYQVAVKLLKGNFPTVESLRRFIQERQVLANLQHPNIARLLDGGTAENGLPYMVMEYIEGTPINLYCEQHALPLRERLRIFLHVCEAVRFAHRNLIVHRDLKPGNILVTPEGQPKLLDFGIAKLLELGGPRQVETATGWRPMTPEYASPEQVQGRPITTATDVYGLGLVLHEMLTGRNPQALPNLSADEITRTICERNPPPPGLGNDLDNIILKALSKEPERRYGSVEEFANDIVRHLEDRPVLAKPDALVYRVRKFARRNRMALAAAALLLLTLAGGVTATLIQSNRAQHQAERAQRRFNQVRRLANTLIFDVEAKLRGVAGALAGREVLLKTALQYLDELYKEVGDDAALKRELAEAYRRIGDVQGSITDPNLGLVTDSLASYRRAAELSGAVAAAQPRDGRSQMDYAMHLVTLGETLIALGKRQEARDLLGSAIPHAEAAIRLIQEKSVNPHLALWRIHIVRGDSLFEENKQLEAIEVYKAALAVAEVGAARTQGLFENSRLAAVHARLGRSYANLKNIDEAMSAFAKSIALREFVEQRASPDQRRTREIFAVKLMACGTLGNQTLGTQARAAESQTFCKQAVESARRAYSAEPGSARAREDLADSLHYSARPLVKSNPKEAAALMREALPMAERLASQSPETRYHWQRLSRMYRTMMQLARGKEADHWASLQRRAESRQKAPAN